MITGIDFVSIPVIDMARARAFYRDTLGLKPVPPAGEAWDEFDKEKNAGASTAESWVEFDLGDGPALALVDNAAYGVPTAPVTAGSLAIAFQDFEGMVELMKQQGRLKQDAFESPGCHGAFFTDPEGNAMCLHRRKAEPARDRMIDFVVLPVEDMARARAFYEGELGLTPATVSEAMWTEYVLPDDSALALGDMRAMGIPFAPNIGGAVGFRTQALDAAFAKLKALGMASAEELLESPVCHMAFVHDPEGNELILHRHK
ncbi:MAG: glyoxalase [Cyanobacteria bacterium RYN_339]|nr:glyoxalase [Cyanobacteria bacterium RYN_339]